MPSAAKDPPLDLFLGDALLFGNRSYDRVERADLEPRMAGYDDTTAMRVGTVDGGSRLTNRTISEPPETPTKLVPGHVAGETATHDPSSASCRHQRRSGKR